jgi:transposase-like protein
MTPISFKRHRFPPIIIQHAIWLYARFTLSFRDIEELLAERGIDVSNETVRRWFLKFGRLIAGNLRRSRPRPSPRWHLDEMVIKIRDRKYWLWRAVDDEGEVLDFLVQRRRCARSAGRLLRKLLKKQGFAPKRISTDKLKSYPVAIRKERLSAVHDQGLRANNRAENSHQPVRRRERKQQRFNLQNVSGRDLCRLAAMLPCSLILVAAHCGRPQQLTCQCRHRPSERLRSAWNFRLPRC